LITQELTDQTQIFERRNYETLRRQKIAPEIGRFAIEGLRRRRYEEITSGIAEALPGVVKTEYAFDLKDGKLVAKDGQNIEELIKKGYENDQLITQRDPEFYEPFLPYRSVYEKEEFYEQEAMANEEVDYNTLVTFSPYTEEFDVEPLTKKDKEDPNHPRNKVIRAGQKPQFKRAMLRISHWDGDQLHIFTRSIDKSSIDLLKETAKKSLDYEFQAEDSTAMLGERVRLNNSDGSWRDLPNSIVAAADVILTERFGTKHIQGRTEKEAKDLQKFVESETQIINSLLKIDSELAKQHDTFESYKRAFDDEMYNHIALLKKRLEFGITDKVADIKAASGGAGAVARAEGQTFDMCGNVIGPNSAAAQAASQTGFESLARLTNKEVQCPFCREKVVVAKKDLDNGKLYCKECDTGVDVCTGQKFSRGRKLKKLGERVMSFFEIIAEDFAKIKQQEKAKQLAKREREELEKQQNSHDFKLSA
jgi:hypothetical protein